MKQTEREEAGWLRLREFYTRYHRPIFQIDAKQTTIRECEYSLTKWEWYTPNPPLCEIAVATLAKFVAGMANAIQEQDIESADREQQMRLFDQPAKTTRPTKLATLEHTTCNKHLRQIQAMLDAAGPPSRGHRSALGMLKEQKCQPRQVEREDLSKIYDACDAARFPRLPMIHPGDWWRALFTMAYTTGCRRGVLLGLPAAGVDLVKRLVTVPAALDKCDMERIKPLHAANVRPLLRIRSADPLLFAWPHTTKTWYATFRTIQKEAGFGPDSRYKLHDFKRACGQALGESGASDLVVDYMLDHGNQKTSRFYIPGLRESIKAVPAMPIPRAMLRESA